MPALPATSDFTAAATQVAAQTAYGSQRDFLAGLLGTDGAAATALATLGALGGRYLAKTSAYTLTATDRGALIHATSGTWTLSLLASASAAAGFSFAALNGGSGVLTLDPSGSEAIDGATTITLQPGAGAIVICTGTGWFTLPMAGPGQSSSIDATAGRVLRVAANGGAFGWGNLGTLPVLADFDSIATASGVYRWNVSTAGTRHADFATGAGVVEILVKDAGTIIQRVMRDSVSGINGGNYRRIYASGAWGAWDVAVMRSSLLGTVSQSGGVATGAVIERGANSNGEYARFADGTQICTVGNLSAANASTASGALFRSADVAWTFPAAFVGTTHLVVSADVDDADAWGAVNTLTTTGCNVRALSSVTKAGALAVRAQAIGRWF